MKIIKTEDALGHVLCHDITQIIRNVKKGVAFKKGHIVTNKDIPVLLSLGKDNLYVLEIEKGMLHENDAAQILYDICAGADESFKKSSVSEGKIEIIANVDGLFVVDTQRLLNINRIGEISIATRSSNHPVKKGDKLAGMRVIPLLIDEKQLKLAKSVGGDTPILSIKPINSKKIGIITTGNEIYHKRIEDTFTDVVKEKLAEYNSHDVSHIILPDSHEQVTQNILKMIEDGAEMILCTGGMSVDPDDQTPLAIKNTGADVITYGSPMLPGAMFMLAYYKGKIPILGLPGCVMYMRRTVFDVFLPRILADIKIQKIDIAAAGHGGLCLNCEQCHFPNCGFGKV